MTTLKAKMIDKLVIYFMEKGKFMTYPEYRDAADGPYKPVLIKRHVGSWSRVEALIKNHYPEEAAFIMGEQEKQEPVEVQVNEEVNETESDDE